MLADNLILLRGLKGLTQEQAAEIAGVTRQSYSKWEQLSLIHISLDQKDMLAGVKRSIHSGAACRNARGRPSRDAKDSGLRPHQNTSGSFRGSFRRWKA